MTEEIKSEASYEQDNMLRDLRSQVNDLTAAVQTNYRQLEQLLIFTIQQQTSFNDAVQVINRQSQMLSEVSRWKDSQTARLADLEVNLQTVEDDVKDVLQEIQTLPGEFQTIRDAINNIRIFKQEY